MQLYHHPFSLESQKVRLALEEKGIDYSSIRVNPLKGKNMNLEFFRMSPSGRLPILKNADHVLFGTMAIIQYIDHINAPLGGNEIDHGKELEWMKKIDAWNPKLFTLTHIPHKHIVFFSRFKRRVTIARMADGPDLASKYHLRLHDAYATEEQLKNPDAVNASKQQLVSLLDDADDCLGTSSHLAGEEFSVADVMFIPILGRLELLNIADEYIKTRTNLSYYWNRMKSRKSYKAVIGKYFSGWRKYRTLYSTYMAVWFRNVFRSY